MGRFLVAVLAGGIAAGALGAPSTAALAAALTAEQIVDRSVEARGGLKAWRKIDSIIWVGHLESTRSPVPSLPFKLEQKRPNKSRFEINQPGQRSMRVFDGVAGWKMRTGEDGRPDIQRFTPEEAKFAREAAGLEGPLIDFRAKGSSVQLEGTDEIDGHEAYRIGVRMVSGERQTVWIDVGSFLETRYDRTAYGQSGASGTVSVKYHDYREVEGLALPSLIEIGGAAGGKPDRMIIERVALNPKIDDREFGGRATPN